MIVQRGSRQWTGAVYAAFFGCLVALGGQPATAGEWQPYLEDSFTSATTMFYTGQAGEAFYTIDDQGRYVIDGMTTDSDSLSALTDSLYYYYLEAQCELAKSTAGELAFTGLVFHYNKSIPGKLSYYVFYYYGDGYYGAKRVVGDQVDIIIPLTPTDALDMYGVNVLGVDAQGTRFDLYINGRYVDGFTDVRIDGGGFGFYISKHSRSAFDDFRVKVERRGGSREDTLPPSASDGGNVADNGPADPGGRVFPDIPKDPDRPQYSWEVGVNKTGKPRPGEPDPPAVDQAEASGAATESATEPDTQPPAATAGEGAGATTEQSALTLRAAGPPVADPATPTAAPSTSPVVEPLPLVPPVEEPTAEPVPEVEPAPAVAPEPEPTSETTTDPESEAEQEPEAEAEPEPTSQPVGATTEDSLANAGRVETLAISQIDLPPGEELLTIREPVTYTTTPTPVEDRLVVFTVEAPDTSSGEALTVSPVDATALAEALPQLPTPRIPQVKLRYPRRPDPQQSRRISQTNPTAANPPRLNPSQHLHRPCRSPNSNRRRHR